MPAGTEFPCKFYIKDIDSGPNGVVNCALRPENEAHLELIKSPLQIGQKDSNGFNLAFSIRTKHPLDREDMTIWPGGNPGFTIVCSDSPIDNSARKTTMLDVALIIEDENECAPKLKDPNSGQIAEQIAINFLENEPANTSVGTLQTIDCDIGKQ